MSSTNAEIAVGLYFDTEFEKGCKVLTTPGTVKGGGPWDFTGLDSDGVEVTFHASMVVRSYTALTGDNTRAFRRD